MTNLRILHSDLQYPCIITNAADEEMDRLIENGLTERRAIENIAERVTGTFEIIDAFDIPTSDEFRDAWEQSGAAIKINLNTAKEIKRKRIRGERATRWDDADAEWFKAMELNDEKRITAANDLKTKLRDAPAHSRIMNATTPAMLSVITFDDVLADEN